MVLIDLSAETSFTVIGDPVPLPRTRVNLASRRWYETKSTKIAKATIRSVAKHWCVKPLKGPLKVKLNYFFKKSKANKSRLINVSSHHVQARLISVVLS